jgi:hypothetical protein
MSFGGSSSSSDTRFERKGTTTGTSFYNFLPQQRSQFESAITDSKPFASSESQSYLKNLLGSSAEGLVPYGRSFFDGLIADHGVDRNFLGRSALERTAQVDPFSSNYENNSYAGYKDRVQQILADVASGPQATRGGTAATGFMQSDALNQMQNQREEQIRQNRLVDGQLQQGATSMLQNLYQQDSASQAQAGKVYNDTVMGVRGIQSNAAELDNQRQSMFNQFLPAAYQMLVPQNQKQVEQMSGRGSQSGSTMTAGVSVCCFIFMEAYKGKMPWFVRACRDDFAPENSKRRAGYRRMANWLVPAMQKSKIIRALTWLLMIKPMTLWGGYHKKAQGYEHGKYFKPFVWFWFKFWEKYGNATA